MGTLEYMAPELLSPYRASPEGKKKNDGGDGNSSDGNGSSGGNGGRASATPASDVFALAVALNELLTATPPYSDCTKAGEPEAHTVLEAGYGRMELAAAVCSAGLRPTLPGEGARAGEGGGALTAAVEAARASLAAGGGGGEGALGPLMLPPPEYVLLMAACWAADPSERPSAAEASRAFEAMLGKYPRVSLEQQEQQGAAVGPQTSGQLLPKEEPVSDEARAAARLAPLVAAGAAAAAAARAAADRQEHEDDDPLAALLRRQGLVVSSSSSSKISSGAFETIGPREGMEDRHVVASSGGGGGGGGSGGSPSSSPAWHLAAVLDGHRGAECADSAARALPRALKGAAAAALAEFSQQQQEQASTATAPSAAPVVCVSAADPLDDPVAAALAASFLAADARFLLDWQAGEVGRKLAGAAGGQASAAPPAPPRCPGATALALLAVQGGRRLYVANAGDSRAFLFVPPTSPNGTTQIYPLSRDHAASSAPDEAARVAAAGGRVAAGGRIGDAALAVTRALGDWDLKGPAAVGAAVEAAGAGGHEGEQKQQLAAALDRGPGNRGLTALPEVRCVSFGGGDANPPPGAFAVLATDGVWDTLPPEDAAALVRDTAKDPRMCAQRLVGESALRGSRDNATALVVFLSSSGALEVVWASDRDGAAVPASAPTAYGTRSTCLLEDNDVEMRD
jgi:serine/threonine protein phosphatase PrpC